MFQLTKAVEYAVLLLISLSNNGQQPVSLSQVAQQKNLPLKYLEKIAGQLRKKGILKSKEGASGGYYLTKTEEEISLIDIVRAVEGKRGLVSCIHGQCQREDFCFHKKIWLKLDAKLKKEMEKIKLTDLIF